MGIQGNDKADSFAKAAINIPPNKTSKLPYTDLKHKIKQIITKNGNNCGMKMPKTSSAK